jgi:dTDP-4-dehydrorhamnose reductase
MALYDSILITGGRGMLAHAFSQVLASRDVGATIVGHQECDIVNRDGVACAMDRVRPTLVINCAAYTKVDLAEKEEDQANACNGHGPGVLAAECQRRSVPLVHFSTDYVFDGSLRRPLRPADPVGPQSAYGRSKLMGERAIAKVPGLASLIIRTAWLYGPNGPNFVQTMLNVARAGKPLRVINDQVGNPTYTFDLAAATLDLVERGARGIWHVSNAGETTWFDFAKAVFEEWGLTPDLQPTTSAAWKLSKPDSAIRPAYSVFDLSLTEQRLGRPMRPWRAALADFHARTTDAPT